MKNPLKKQHNGLMIGAVAAGAAVAGGLAWLLFTEKGKSILNACKAAAIENGKDLLAGFISDKTGVSRQLIKPATDVVID